MTTLRNDFDYGTDCHYRYRSSMLEEQDIQIAQHSIGEFLRRAGVATGEPSWRVANLGCGGESLAMRRLGFQNIDLFDLSALQIERFRQYQKEHRIDGITASRADATTHDFGVAQYDLVVARCVIHHTLDPLGAIAKLLRALRPGGYFLYMAYQSGAFRWFFVDMMRRLIEPKDINELLPMIDRLELSPYRKIQISDDLLTQNIYLKTLESYWLHFVRNGCEIPTRNSNHPSGPSHVARISHFTLVARKSDSSARSDRSIGETDDQLAFQWSTSPGYAQLVLNYHYHFEQLRSLDVVRKFSLLAGLHDLAMSLDNFRVDDVEGPSRHVEACYQRAYALIVQHVGARN